MNLFSDNICRERPVTSIFLLRIGNGFVGSCFSAGGSKLDDDPGSRRSGYGSALESGVAADKAGLFAPIDINCRSEHFRSCALDTGSQSESTSSDSCAGYIAVNGCGLALHVSGGYF